ncbi:MAG: tetratricopeptide repeat protein, partial [Pseudomonadota bacterium]
SVRRVDDHLRVTAQLIDAVADRHVWAERYDRDAAAVSEVLDEVVRQVVSGVDVAFGAPERRRNPRRGGASTEAHDLLLRGLDRFHRFTADDVREAIDLLRTAVNADPAFVDTRAWLARMLVYGAISGGEDEPDRAIVAAVEAARAARAIDPADPHAQAVLGWALLWQGRTDDAVQHTAAAAAREPNFADGHLWHAMTLASLGSGEEARRAVERGMRLNPHFSVTYLHAMALAEFARGDFAEAMLLSERCHRRSPGFAPGQLLRAVLLLRLGPHADAVEAAALATAMNASTRRRLSRFFAEPRLRAVYGAFLREAGLLDGAEPSDTDHPGG